MRPGFVSHQRGISPQCNAHDPLPRSRHPGHTCGSRGEAGDRYEGVTLAFVNPVNGEPVFPTLATKSE
jgi:hypothetical protein